MSTTDVFRRITGALEAAGIPYMLTGSFASAYHGAPRATQDIDLVIAPAADQIRRLVRLLPETEYYADLDMALEALARQSQFNVVDFATGWKVDMIVRKSRPFSREEFDRRIAVEMDGVRLFIASAEDLAVAKLEWAKIGQSQRQLEDVAGILAVRGANLDRPYIERWVRDLGLDSQWRLARALAGEAA